MKKLIIIIITLVIITMTCILTSSFDLPQNEIESYSEYKDTVSFDFKPNKFGEKSLKKYVKAIGIKYPKIVVAQARLETGNFKSNVFITKNNLFGFRLKSGYLEFNNWMECCNYYKAWQERHYNGGDYFEFLKEIGYAEDSSYILKVKQCLK